VRPALAGLALLTGLGPINLQFVPAEHWALTDGAHAKALRTSEGGQWILINAEADIEDFELIVLHEATHLIAWDRYGEDIEEHGPEFQQICLQLITRKQNQYCRSHR